VPKYIRALVSSHPVPKTAGAERFGATAKQDQATTASLAVVEGPGSPQLELTYIQMVLGRIQPSTTIDQSVVRIAATPVLQRLPKLAWWLVLFGCGTKTSQHLLFWDRVAGDQSSNNLAQCRY